MNVSRLPGVWICAAFLVAALAVVSTPGSAQDNQCDPGESPDVIVGDLHQERRHGSVDGITAFSIGTTSCNVGSCELLWHDSTNEHPVIGQNMFRLKDGRFEQIGMSWLKHGFFALSQGLCSSECIGTNGTSLGVNCSDPYSSFLNGQQSGLGPRSEVNATTGAYPYPFTGIGEGGSTIFKRLQVHNEDLDPDKNVGAAYFVEGQYVTADDAAAGNQNNNVSYRGIDVFGSGTFFDINLTGETRRMQPAVFGWVGAQAGVRLRRVSADGDGLFYVVSAATDNGDGTWHYEYAVHNLNSHRSAQSFSVPLPPGTTVTNVGFHDVDYHSGEPYDGTDWYPEVDPVWQPNTVVWYTEEFGDNENANALRWGTLYNFRFDADMPPNDGVGEVTLGLFRPGTPTDVTGFAYHPALCNFDGVCGPTEDCANCPDDCLTAGGQGGADACCGDGFCDPVEGSCACSTDCGFPLAEELACDNGVDDDCDGQADCADGDCCADGNCEDGIDADSDLFANCDCDDANDKVWERPGEVPGLLLSKDPSGTVLDWNSPLDPGGDEVIYSTIRSADPADFVSGLCLPTGNPAQRSFTEMETPGANSGYYYLIRAENECPAELGEGDLGSGLDNIERVATSCP